MSYSQPRGFAAGLLSALALAASSVGLRPAAAVAQAAAPAAADRPSDADRQFMTGMIVHHAQAILMAGWAPSHGAGPSVLELCERIGISQRDEIAAMTRWLRERGLEVPDADTSASRRVAGLDRGMAGMSRQMPAMPGMGGSMMMPGMLGGAQLARLDSARGPAFDRLFLTFMIQHHQGALTMVAQLMNEPGAGQDGLVFQFATDVNADQTAEIDRMNRMLAAMPPAQRSP
ncbi:MAG TPA: DUF305 domain-containing protein [Gemmatimonadales bacterium]|nr:DUF305 domain-containing protein [Gemmatimonadales bacterium]